MVLWFAACFRTKEISCLRRQNKANSCLRGASYITLEPALRSLHQAVWLNLQLKQGRSIAIYVLNSSRGKLKASSRGVDWEIETRIEGTNESHYAVANLLDPWNPDASTRIYG